MHSSDTHWGQNIYEVVFEKKTRLQEGYVEKFRPSQKLQGAVDINCFAHSLTLGSKTFWSQIWIFAHLLFQKKFTILSLVQRLKKLKSASFPTWFLRSSAFEDKKKGFQQVRCHHFHVEKAADFNFFSLWINERIRFFFWNSRCAKIQIRLQNVFDPNVSEWVKQLMSTSPCSFCAFVETRTTVRA